MKAFIIVLIIIALIMTIFSCDIGGTEYDECIHGITPGGEPHCGRPTENGSKYCSFHKTMTGITD